MNIKHIKLFENSGNRYIAVVKQDGEGCDYMIECGTNWIQLESTNEIDAIKEMESIIDGEDDAICRKCCNFKRNRIQC